MLPSSIAPLAAADRTGNSVRDDGRGIDPAILSWWDQPNSSLCFLRPLSSWTLWIDHAYLWRWPLLPHLHSVLWFMGLWLAWRAIFLRYLPARVANMGLLLMAASSSIAMTVAWIASRHALVGGCFGVWGLYHCLASRDPDRAGPGARAFAAELDGTDARASAADVGGANARESAVDRAGRVSAADLGGADARESALGAGVGSA